MPNLSADSYLFDAGVLALYFAGKHAVKPYFDRVASGRAIGIVSEVNLAEFYYKSGQGRGLETAEVWYRQVRQARGFEVVPPDENITRNAAVCKVRMNHLSLADCFALATAQERARVLITTDSFLGKTKMKGVRMVYVSPR